MLTAGAVVQERGIHGRHAQEDVDLLALDDLGRLGRVEARQKGKQAAGAHAHAQADDETEHVEQGQRAELDDVALDVGEVVADLDVAAQVVVG